MVVVLLYVSIQQKVRRLTSTLRRLSLIIRLGCTVASE
jgi:hypothetical protein